MEHRKGSCSPSSIDIWSGKDRRKKEIKGSVHCFLLSVSTLVAPISSYGIYPVSPDIFLVSGVEPTHSNLAIELASPSQSSTQSYLIFLCIPIAISALAILNHHEALYSELSLHNRNLLFILTMERDH